MICSWRLLEFTLGLLQYNTAARCVIISWEKWQGEVILPGAMASGQRPRVTREHGTYERPSQEAKYLKSRGHVDAFWSLDYKLIWIHVVLDSMGYRPEWWKILQRLCWWWWWHELDPMLPLKTRTATMQVSQIILRTCTWCNYTEEKWHMITC